MAVHYGLRFFTDLPDQAPARYRLSAVIRDSRGRSVDQLVEELEVPVQELVAELLLDRERIGPGEEFTLALYNYGPTILTGAFC